MCIGQRNGLGKRLRFLVGGKRKVLTAQEVVLEEFELAASLDAWSAASLGASFSSFWLASW